MLKKSTTSTVTVAVRVRPLSEKEKLIPDQAFALELGEKHVALPNDSTHVFDAVFGPEHSTRDLYDAIAEPIISSSLAGINGTIFAYGQTASGKTFSMQGSETEPGILRLAARQLFEVASNAEWTYSFVVSYVEIYNERVKDLMNNATGKYAQDAASDLKIREDRQNGFYVDGVVERTVSDYESLIEMFEEGEKRRHVAGTDMNLKSSRSHTIFTINVTAKQKPNETGDFAFGTLKSRLSLVDLAGSESARLTNAEGERLKEGAQINKSLLALSLVISTLAKTGGKDAHVKFRDSKLTQILQPSLAGNCRTAVICCVTPAASYLSETSSTLKFASSAKHIQTQYVVNQIADVTRSMKSYQEQVEALTRALHDEKHARSAAESEISAKGAERVLELERKVLTLESQLQSQETSQMELEEQLKLKEEDLIRLEKEAQEAVEELKAALVTQREQTLAAADEQVQALHAELVRCEEASAAMQSQMKAQVEREREEWQKLLEETKSKLKSEINELKDSIAHYQNTIEELKAMHLQEKEKWESEMKAVEMKLKDEEENRMGILESNLRAEIESVNNQREQLEHANQILKSELDRTKELLEHTIRETDDLKHQLSESKIATMKVLDELTKAKEEKTEMESKLGRDAAEALEALQKRLDDELQARMEVHRSEIAALKSTYEEESSAARARHNQVLDEMENRLQESQQKNSATVLELQSQLNVEETSRKAAEDEQNVLREQIQKLEQALATEKKRSSQGHQDLQEEIQVAQTRIANLQSQLDTERAAQRVSAEEFVASQEQLSSQLQKQIQAVHELNVMLREERAKLQIANEQVSNLRADMARMKEDHCMELESLRSSPQDGEDYQVTELRKEIATRKKENVSLNQRLADFRKLHEEEIREKEEELGRLKAELEGDDRVHELADAKEYIQELEERLGRIDQVQEQLRLENSQEVKSLEKQLEELRTRNANLEKTKLTAEKAQKIREMQEENQRLKEENKKLLATQQRYTGLKQRMEQSVKETSVFGDENDRR